MNATLTVIFVIMAIISFLLMLAENERIHKSHALVAFVVCMITVMVLRLIG